MATKQKRKTAARKARQQAAMAALVKHTGSVPMVPTKYGLVPISINLLPQKAKQRIVETYERTKR